MIILRLIKIFVIVLIGVWLLNACRYNEQFLDDSGIELEFSRDTVLFDTVFTSVGSATRSFKIINPFSEAVQLSRIYLPKGDQSFFRLNVNGVSGNDVEDVRISGGDSIYVFTEITVDPDQPLSESPFIIEEQLFVELNGSAQTVQLEAWGQNANYIPKSKTKGSFALLSCDFEDVEWNDPKPYVIYGILLIDSCNLVLPPDCKVYVHGGIAQTEDLGSYNDGRIIVLKDGSIRSAGTTDAPVYIQGDRLEPEYEGVWAQWTGIQIFPESQNNIFENTIIRDGITGVSVDSNATAIFKNAQVYNHSSRALVTFHPKEVVIENSLFHSSSNETVLLKYGGKVSIDYSTIGGYSNQSGALYADNYRCTQQIFCGPILVNPLDLQVRNTIISGNGTDELIIVDGTDKMEEGVLNFEFEHALIKLDTLLNSGNYPNFFDQCRNCFSIKREEALFFNVDEYDFHLDTLSQAEAKAIPISGIFQDLEGNTRDIQNPDIGCYEYQY